MLDIEIFLKDEPLYYEGKKVGTAPCLSIGNYTPLTDQDKKIVRSFYEELSPAHRAIFSIMIHSLGQAFFASHIIHTIDQTSNPFAQQKLFNLLKIVDGRTIKSEEELKNKQKQILNIMFKNFKPTHMVAMMIELKDMHDRSKKDNKVTPIQDEIFARGIAKCVQSIRDIPEKQKALQIQRFCTRPTHRWQRIAYSHT